MYEEIDLRQYVRILFRNIHWIAASAFLCAAMGLIVSLVLPRMYEASALVVVTKPRYVMQFDARFETTQQLQPAYKAYPELAMSGDVLRDVMDNLPPSAGSIVSIDGLRGRLDAASAVDPSLIRLTVGSRSPEEARDIANVWATAFVERADAVYGQGSEQADFFTAQLSRAEAELQDAEAALIEFQSRNDVAILDNRLKSEVQTQFDYLASQRNAAYLIQDIRNLQTQLSGQSGTYETSLADQMTALFLQIKAFNAQIGSPAQFQIGGAETLSSLNTTEQVAFLDDLTDVLEQHSEALTTRLGEVEPRILTLQQQVQVKRTEEDRLTRARDLAKEAFLILSRKAQESQIAAEDSGGGVVIASHAGLPARPSNPSKLMVTAVAGVLGGSLAVMGVFGLAWWRDEAEADVQERAAEAPGVVLPPASPITEPDPQAKLSTGVG